MISNLNITALQKRFDPSIGTFESSICPLMPPQSVASDAAKRNLVRFRERGLNWASHQHLCPTKTSRAGLKIHRQCPGKRCRFFVSDSFWRSRNADKHHIHFLCPVLKRETKNRWLIQTKFLIQLTLQSTLHFRAVSWWNKHFKQGRIKV